MHILSTNFGNAIRTIRENKGLSQKQVSQLLYSPINISKIENGVQQIKIDFLPELLAALDTSFDEFLAISRKNQLSTYDYVLTEIRNKSAELNQTQWLHLLQLVEAEVANSKVNFEHRTSLLLSQMRCFYHLNFTNDTHAIQMAGTKLWEHYQYAINAPMLSDFARLPLIIATAPEEYLSFMLTHLLAQKSMPPAIKISCILNYGKRALVKENFDLLLLSLQYLEQFDIHHSSSANICEYSIMKGLHQIQLSQTQQKGKSLIKQALLLAKNNNHLRLYHNWQTYCDQVL